MAADLAIINARVRTLDPAQPFAEAVAVRRGTIVAVGDTASVREACDARTEIHDARGNALIGKLGKSARERGSFGTWAARSQPTRRRTVVSPQWSTD